MLLALQLNNLLSSAAALAFIGPDIDDLTFPEDIDISPEVDITDRFISASSYVLIGTLPEGMTFTNGVFSGRPTTPGTYGPFIVRAS